MQKTWRLPTESKDPDELPLLPDSEVANLKRKATMNVGSKALSLSILLNLSFALYLGFLCFPVSQPKSHGRLMNLGLYSPASEHVEHVPHVFRMAFLDDQSPYQGWPDDEKDQLWQDMYSKGMAIRIDEESARRLINKTEHAPVAGMEHDYVVGLDVFHQLHCLNMIRQSIYPKRYNSSIIRQDGTIDFLAWSHLDHCIEAIRESLTCSADVSVVPYRWHPETKIAEPDIRSVHVCRNFTKIRDWAFDRFVPTTSKRMHVEDGVVVDYSGAGRDPELVLAKELANPAHWNKTMHDL